MLHTLIEVLNDKISNLPYVHRYGGLVRTATRLVEVGVDSGQYITELFPVSCSVSATQCWEDSRYLDLVPDDRYSSVFYWESVGTGLSVTPTGINERSAKKDKVRLSGRVSLVGWLNMPALGYVDECNLADRVVADLMRQLNVTYKNINSPIQIDKLTFKPSGIVDKDASKIFGNYSYATRQDAFLYPFDFFAMIFDVEAITRWECLQAFTPTNPVNCEFV